jgi:signal recognition particle subunit SRP72
VDAATRAIALNNQLSIEPHSNPFENYRIHNAANQAFAKSKPFLAQSQIFSNNSLLLSSKAHKSITSNKGPHYAASLIQLYNELPAQSEATFLPKLTANFHHDETDVGTALLLIQSQMQNGSLQLAAVTLEKLFHALKDRNDVKYMPGLISLAVLLFPKVGREDKATALLVEAKSYWISKGDTVHLVVKIANIQSANTTTLRNFATLARLNQLLTLQPSPSHSQELEALVNEQQAYLNDYPSDISTHAVLAALYSVTSPSNAMQHSSHLPPISTLTKSVDAQQLESQGIPSNAANLASLKRKMTNKIRSRKRRVRGGKTFDSTKDVDPERWLPLRERSYYKPAKSKKRKTGGATQGGATEGDVAAQVGVAQAETKKADSGGKKKKKARK